MRLVEVLETVFEVYRANGRTVLGLTAVVVIPGYVAAVAVARSLAPIAQRLADPATLASTRAIDAALIGDVVGAIGLSLLALAVDQVTIAFVAAVLAIAVGRPGGPALRAPESLRELARIAVRVVLAILLILLAVCALVVAWIVIQVPLALTVGAPAGASGGPGTFAAILLGVGVFAGAVFILVRWSLTIPALALEGTGPVAALGRSWRLVSGSTWRILGYLVLIGVAVVILDATFVQTVAAVASAISPAAGTTAELAVGAVAQVVLVPVGALTTIVLFHDLRVRGGMPRGGMARGGMPRS